MPNYLTPTAELQQVIELENGMLANGGSGGNMNLQAQALLNSVYYLLGLFQQVQSGQMQIYSPTLQAAIGGYPEGALVGRTDLSGWWFSQVANNLTNPETFGAGWVPFGSLNGPLIVPLTNSNVTLTALQAANDTFILTGALTANVNLVLPSWVGKKWTIVNNTTGAFTVTATVGTGSTVVPTAGSTSVICLSTGLMGGNTSTSWVSGLPTSLPATHGVLWNNGGALSIS